MASFRAYIQFLILLWYITGDIVKNIFLFVVIVFYTAAGCDHLPSTGSVLVEVPDVIAEDIIAPSIEEDVTSAKEVFIVHNPIILEPVHLYPPGPYAIDKFQVMPNMEFYDPWKDEWIELKDFYLSEDVKALLIVSSAGWCGPCLKEAAALIDIYDKYAPDGLEIIYTLGNTNIPGDVPFDGVYDSPNSAGFAADLYFMDSWVHMTETEAGKPINYNMYADPSREFIPYAPTHAWPFSMLVTTKDMGVRLVEEGFWSPLVINKIEMALYNDVPNIPFN
jgi:thiol-disulfide isomerase/thioredoxin